MEQRYAAPPEAEFVSHADFYQNSAYAAFDQEHRSGGSFGLQLMQVTQDPFDLIDSPLPDAVFAQTHNDIDEVLFDLGDGVRSGPGGKGSITYYPAQTEARTRVDKPHVLTVLAFEHNKLQNLMTSSECEMSVFEPLAARMTNHAYAAQLMDRMWQAVSKTGPMAGLYLDGLTLQFLAVMACDSSLAPLGSDHIEDRRIARTIDYIEENLDQPLTVTELASIAALSPSQFSRVFKSTTGQAVWAFVQQRRIERARNLLIHSIAPISQIAFDCGFANQNHMTNLFRRHFGVTPGTLRNLR